MPLHPATRLEGEVQPAGKTPAGQAMQQVDVVCVLCGEVCGVLEATVSAPLSARFHAAGTDRLSPRSVGRMRCTRCGGTVVAGERRVIQPREETVDWRVDKPRRGRPPKLLVEQRDREIAS